ncbi:hypothetical protein ACJMK2_034134 [Sinanodonta woodiana]|uniref:Transmembrane protein 26 n=1 Tax=Sinanodonta woodiana TaxID=1069815 RepID=A0ABD3WR72_SINWO
MNLFDVLRAVLVRLVLLVHSLLVIWLTTSITKRRVYWLLAAADIGIILEGFVTIFYKKAKEWKWFCPCFFFYMLGTVPSIWLLEIHRMDEYVRNKNHYNPNTSEPENTTSYGNKQVLEAIQGITIPIELPIDIWVNVMEQLFLYLMIVGRWILPRGDTSRDQLSQLLFVFIGIASDIMELFTLFDEDPVKENLELRYAVLVIWTVSLVQFTLVLTSTNSPKKQRVASNLKVNSNSLDQTFCLMKFFQTEIWSVCVSILLQDGPFLTIRVYTIATYKLLNYSIVFFTAKNALLVAILMYRMTVICRDREESITKTDTEKALLDDSDLRRKERIQMSKSMESVRFNGNDKGLFVIPAKGHVTGQGRAPHRQNGQKMRTKVDMERRKIYDMAI